MDQGFQSWELQRGIRLHVLQTMKYKTTRVKVYLRLPFRREEVAPNALVPLVMRRGTSRLPDRAIARHLESLYGAGFHTDAGKTGEIQTLEFDLQIAESRYLQAAGDLFGEGLEFLADMVERPRLEHGGFHAAYVEMERENLRRRIEGLIDERFQYAVQRCYEEMCRDEPFGTYRYGRVEDLQSVDPAGLYERYQRLLRQSAVDVFVVGGIEPAAVRDAVASAFSLTPREPADGAPAVTREAPANPREVEERLDVQQGILVLGYRTGVQFCDDAYPALLVYNGVLGGFSHSKLFMNVRERASLAYSAYSRLETTKGVQVLFAGIDVRKKAQALDIMLRQVEAMRAGEISDEELEATRRGLANGFLSMQDEPGQVIHARMMGVINGRERPVEETVAAVRAVRKDDVVAVARRVALDTIYFLRDDRADGGDA